MHTYAKSGVYHVCLTVTANNGSEECTDVFCYDVDVNDGCVPEDCSLSADFDFVLEDCNLYLIDHSTGGAATTIANWSWDIAGIISLNGDIANYTFSSDGDFTVCLRINGFDGFGNYCDDMICKDVHVENCNEARLNGTDRRSVYVLIPNPSAGDFTLQITTVTEGKMQVELGNFYGEILEQRSLNITKGRNQFAFHLKDHSKGIYFLRIKNEGEDTLLKLVIQ